MYPKLTFLSFLLFLMKTFILSYHFPVILQSSRFLLLLLSFTYIISHSPCLPHNSSLLALHPRYYSSPIISHSCKVSKPYQFLIVWHYFVDVTLCFHFSLYPFILLLWFFWIFNFDCLEQLSVSLSHKHTLSFSLSFYWN